MSHVILTPYCHLPCRTVSVEWYVTTSTSFLSPYYPSYPRQIPSVEVVSLLLSYCLLISALIFLISHRNCCDILTVASILLLLLSPKSNHQVLLNSRSPLSSHCSLQLFASHRLGVVVNCLLLLVRLSTVLTIAILMVVVSMNDVWTLASRGVQPYLLLPPLLTHRCLCPRN
jgi:hypothetical protein